MMRPLFWLEQDTRCLAYASILLWLMTIMCSDGEGRGVMEARQYSQDGEFARSQAQNRQQREADNEEGDGCQVEASEE